jgi:excinuclease ABC subunit A
MLPESRERGYKPGRFSFNVKGGRCEACQGDGLKRIEMNFLPDVYVTCDVCRGRATTRNAAGEIQGHSIADLLEMTVEEALPLLETNPQIRPKLQTLLDVGWATFIWASRPPRFRAAKRSASSWRKN